MRRSAARQPWPPGGPGCGYAVKGSGAGRTRCPRGRPARATSRRPSARWPPGGPARSRRSSSTLVAPAAASRGAGRLRGRRSSAGGRRSQPGGPISTLPSPSRPTTTKPKTSHQNAASASGPASTTSSLIRHAMADASRWRGRRGRSTSTSSCRRRTAPPPGRRSGGQRLQHRRELRQPRDQHDRLALGYPVDRRLRDVLRRQEAGGGTPSNSPVSTTLGQIVVTPTWSWPSWAISTRSDSVNPTAAHLLAP